MSIDLLAAPDAPGSRAAVEAEPVRASGAGRVWDEIYWWMRADRNSRAAWYALDCRVRGWAWRDLAGRGAHVAEDAVADTCARVVLHFDRARGADTFQGFVYGQYLNARRRALQELSAAGAPLGAIDPPAPPADDPDEAALAVLACCLAALPARERRALKLRYFDELSMAAIGSALGVTEDNARQILLRARRRLRDAVVAALGADGAGARPMRS
jgi:RNA polymerase sigma factor (sigma-70 family)